MKLGVGLIGLLTVGGLAFAAVADGAERAPRFVSYRIGGVDIRSTDKAKPDAFVLDSGAKYCLHISHSRNSGVQMFLSSEAEMEQSGDLDLKRDAADIRHARIVPMGTELGVKVGDTPQEVLRLLGAPTENDGSPAKTGNGLLHYDYMGGHLHGWSYESWYEFDHGHLVGISIAMQKGREVAG